MKKSFLILLLLSIVGSYYLYHKKGSCDDTKVALWHGSTLQNTEKIDFFNLKFTHVTASCLSSLGKEFVIGSSQLNLEFNIIINNDHSSYQVFSNGRSLRPVRHLEIFHDGDHVNFTLAFARNEASMLMPKQRLKINALAENGTKYEFDNIISYDPSTAHPLSLPKVSYRVEKEFIEACSEVDHYYVESIRIDFEIMNNGLQRHYQKVCVLDNESLVRKGDSLCCKEGFLKETKKISLIRWRGDEKQLSFIESLVTIISDEKARF